jgi:flagellar basal-body rod protein FlgC
MSFFDGYDIATSGMSAQRTRINVTSANIANAKTTHTQEGGPYKRQNVIFEEILQDTAQSKVGVKAIVDSSDKPVMRFEPNHPDANEKGYVAYPDINPVVEMVDLIEAMRSYEANLSSFKTQKKIDSGTIDILKA